MLKENRDGSFDMSCSTATCTDSIILRQEEKDGDFAAAVAEAKDEGWRVVKYDKSPWQHYCPDCVEDWKEKH